MDMAGFWREEMRSFPHGGQGAALWVVRREGEGEAAPLSLLFGWASGRARTRGLAARPPLASFMRAMAGSKEELTRQDGGASLWVEPLLFKGRTGGCLGIWFDAAEPWGEAVFLWGQRLASRLGPLLQQLTRHSVETDGQGTGGQPTLFPLPTAVGAAPGPRRAATVYRRGSELALPRPVTVPGIPGCVGVSEEMIRLGRRLGPIARSGVNVLLHGESGTGKEILARALHLCSDRHQGNFVGQNCAALPESLFESELFGHKAGSFTGAAGDKTGLLASASGGTFFLDEIGDMPLILQIKLLRVMQERRVRRIGELTCRPVDLRFVAATHKDLHREIQEGRFRLDLFYRLKVVSLHIPPLRHRPEDVVPLFTFFLKKRGWDVGGMTITENALTALQTWPWPGNVRELENEVHRFAALHHQERRIRLRHLSPEIQTGETGRIDPMDLGTLRPLEQASEVLEQYLIRKAIAATDGRKAAAARRLGLSRQGLYKKIQRYGMSDLVMSRKGE